MILKTLIKAVIPEQLKAHWRARRMEARYQGNYESWAEAKMVATGYETPEILEQVIAATRATREGEAAWERDSVLFQEPWAHRPLLEMLRSVAEREGMLDVLDFGGAMGSTWWQHREWLDEVDLKRWSVVEQPNFVAAGRREFEQGPLRFYGDVEECLTQGQPNVVLLSSVLPYMENPYDFLKKLVEQFEGMLIIDRTGFVNQGTDRLAVQHVPDSVYAASYPCWFFNREKLLGSLGEDWELEREWASLDGDGQTFSYRGLVLAHRKRNPQTSH